MNTGSDHLGDSVLSQTDRILGSPYFARSATLSRFLRFVVEITLQGKADELKEYRLGVDVFGRGADFDPRIDPIVRMQAAKVRAKLAEYYASEGREDEMLISIPKGGYIPSFTQREVASRATTVAVESQDVQSIAVLPFVSMSTDPENEYFADGLTEELINVLAYIPGLRVVARTTVFCFKNTAKDVREIGAQLKVRTVLEGSVRKSGNQLRVTAQLIDVATGYHLLSRTFPRELKDVFAVQEELASAVVTEIMPQIRTEAAPSVRNYTADLEAYNLYLKATFILSNSYTGARDCVEIFRQVLDKDPTYAPAWAGLANAYCLQCWYGLMASKTSLLLAQNAAQKAIDLDDTLGLGHTILGVVQANLNWDWKSAERSFHRAIAVQPSFAMAHQMYSYMCLLPQRHFAESIALTERALLLNPFDPVLGACAIFTYIAVGDYAAALRQNTLTREAHPRHPVAYGSIGPMYEMEGRWDEAISAYRKAAEFSRRTPYVIASLGHALAKSGALDEAREILDELLTATPYNFAVSLVHLGLGNHGEAIGWLAKGLEDREPHTILIPFDPRFNTLRAEPEFRQLLDKMGLARAATA